MIRSLPGIYSLGLTIKTSLLLVRTMQAQAKEEKSLTVGCGRKQIAAELVNHTQIQ